MQREIFQQTLHDLRWREPPQPFVIELSDGRKIQVDDPLAIALAEKAAVFLSPEYELVEFSTDEIQAVHITAAG
jgi:hypothetical protein